MNVVKAVFVALFAWLVFSIFLVLIGTWNDVKPYSYGEYAGQYVCQYKSSWKYDLSNMYSCDKYSAFKQQLSFSAVFYFAISIVGVPGFLIDLFTRGTTGSSSIWTVLAISPYIWVAVAVIIQHFLERYLRKRKLHDPIQHQN
jgi:hypothetical protein